MNNYISETTDHRLGQGSPNLVLEGRCPAELSFNLPQHTHTETVTDLPKNPQWNVSNKQIMLYWDIHKEKKSKHLPRIIFSPVILYCSSHYTNVPVGGAKDAKMKK